MDNIPYIRVINCLLINEVISAQVENMGLLTAIVNAKYQVSFKQNTLINSCLFLFSLFLWTQ